MVDGALREVQALGHLAIGKPSRNESEDLHFALTEARGPIAPPAANPVPGRAEHGVNRVTIQAPGAYGGLQLVRGGLWGAGRAMRPCLGQRVVNVGRSQESSLWPQHRRWRAAVITGAIQAFVVKRSEDPQVRHGLRSRKDPLSVVGVQSDALPLALR